MSKLKLFFPENKIYQNHSQTDNKISIKFHLTVSTYNNLLFKHGHVVVYKSGRFAAFMAIVNEMCQYSVLAEIMQSHCATFRAPDYTQSTHNAL